MRTVYILVFFTTFVALSVAIQKRYKLKNIYTENDSKYLQLPHANP